jgi:hypothetical protein
MRLASAGGAVPAPRAIAQGHRVLAISVRGRILVPAESAEPLRGNRLRGGRQLSLPAQLRGYAAAIAGDPDVGGFHELQGHTSDTIHAFSASASPSPPLKERRR